MLLFGLQIRLGITGAADDSELELERLFAALTKLLRLNPSFVEGLLVSLWPTVWGRPVPSTPFAVQVITTFGELRQIDVFLVTVFGHVPMNNRLAGLDPHARETQAYRSEYGRVWMRLNHIRTLGSLFTAGLYLVIGVALLTE